MLKRLLDMFSNRAIDAFANDLAQEVAKRYPPALDQPGGRKLSAQRLTKVLESVFEQAVGFKKQHRMGVYRTARLCNNFRWKLEDYGYTKPFVEMATEGLLVYLSRKAGEKKA